MADLLRMTKTADYRRDIDGLRAVAVMIVVFNHLHLRFTGGYVGVDVFFVISGYLISAHIISAMRAGTFSIVDFYQRRIRRIFPAMLAMLLVVAALSYRYLLPQETVAAAQSSLATLFSCSNVLFWHQSGYFDAPSALKPLLHTWSLAVEEQFYIFFPVFLVVVLRWFPSRLKAAIWTVTAISFLAACVWTLHDSTTAFFWAPLRAWELLIGTILSQNYLPAIRSQRLRNLISLAGILLILIPALFFTSTTIFPGLAALPPCLGAAMLIAADDSSESTSESTIVGRILSWRPIVFVGLISYSLYLWHWPILVFQNTSSMLLDRPAEDRLAKLAVLAISFLAATLSWALIETPFRKGRWIATRRPFFFATTAAVLLLIVTGGAAIASRGLPSRYSTEALRLASYTDYDSLDSWRLGACFLNPKFNFDSFSPSVCLQPDPHRRNYLLFGDSLAADLYPGLQKVFPELNIMQATSAACLPLRAPSQVETQYLQNCAKMNDFIYGSYLQQHPPDVVLLAAGWSPSALPQLEKDIRWLQQQHLQVILFGPPIEYDLPLPRLLAVSVRYHNSDTLAHHQRPTAYQLDLQMAKLAKDKWKVGYISVFQILCSPQTNSQSQTLDLHCPVQTPSGIPVLFDEHHFTVEGSVLFAQAIRVANQLSMQTSR